ncbi:MAG TPA: zinc ribbon domain-containing protein, partial [Candidatus Pullichristensenella excrementigallinarum]|nr:zinc ribbon domain-containing protein [Candidatus Pullichristensenella excrementigallinarum]
MYCGYCGKKNSDQMLFCVFCGKPLEVPEQEEEDVRKSRYAPPEDVAQAPSQEGVDGDEERNFAPDAAEEAPEAQEDAASGFEVFDEPDAQATAGGDMPESSEQRLEEQGAEEQVPDLPLEPAIR